MQQSESYTMCRYGQTILDIHRDKDKVLAVNNSWRHINAYQEVWDDSTVPSCISVQDTS